MAKAKTPAKKAPANKKPAAKATGSKATTPRQPAAKASAAKATATKSTAAKASKTKAIAAKATAAKEPKPAVIKKTPRGKPAAGSHADLLRAILENPDDDRARLVYADALQEDGDPRGEYIALSLAKGKAASTRAKELLDAHRGKAWQNFGAKGARYTWRRGFICEVGGKATEIAGAGLMFEVEPIETLSIYGDGGGQLATIVGFPLRIRELSLSINKPEDAEAIANATTLGNLRRLGLAGFGDRAAKILAASTAMPKLERLTAALGSVTADGMAALAKGPLLASVTSLSLAQNNLDAAAMEHLISAPWTRNLDELWLSENDLGDAGVAVLAKGNFPKLRGLSLENNWRQQDQPTLGEGAADALVAAATTTFKHLKVLDLSWNIAGEALARVKAAYGDRLLMRTERFG